MQIMQISGARTGNIGRRKVIVKKMSRLNLQGIFIFLASLALVACGSGDENVLPNEAPTASAVSIIDNNGGDVLVGDTLTGNYSYTDLEGDAEGDSEYRWMREGRPIGGARNISYTLVANDASTSITFEVTPVAEIGTTTGDTVRSSPIAVLSNNNPPTASGVSITDTNGGSILVGDSLNGNYTYSDLEGDAEGATTFRWLRNGIAISGATNSTYTLVAEDGAASITFEVTPVAVTGAITGNAVTSSAIAVLNFPPTASSVDITDTNGGDALLGDSLSGNYVYGDVDGDAEGATALRWLRNGVAISGEAVNGRFQRIRCRRGFFTRFRGRYWSTIGNDRNPVNIHRSGKFSARSNPAYIIFAGKDNLPPVAARILTHNFG